MKANYESRRSMVNKFKKNKGQKRGCAEKYVNSKKANHEMKNAVQRVRQNKFYENVYCHHEETNLWWREQEKQANNGWNNWNGGNDKSDIGWGVDDVNDFCSEFPPNEADLQSKESILCAQRLLLPFPLPMLRLTNEHEVPRYVTPTLNNVAFLGRGSYSLFGDRIRRFV